MQLPNVFLNDLDPDSDLFKSPVLALLLVALLQSRRICLAKPDDWQSMNGSSVPGALHDQVLKKFNNNVLLCREIFGLNGHPLADYKNLVEQIISSDNPRQGFLLEEDLSELEEILSLNPELFRALSDSCQIIPKSSIFTVTENPDDSADNLGFLTLSFKQVITMLLEETDFDGGAPDGDAPDRDAPDGDAPDGDAPDGKGTNARHSIFTPSQREDVRSVSLMMTVYIALLYLALQSIVDSLGYSIGSEIEPDILNKVLSNPVVSDSSSFVVPEGIIEVDNNEDVVTLEVQEGFETVTVDFGHSLQHLQLELDQSELAAASSGNVDGLPLLDELQGAVARSPQESPSPSIQNDEVSIQGAKLIQLSNTDVANILLDSSDQPSETLTVATDGQSSAGLTIESDEQPGETLTFESDEQPGETLTIESDEQPSETPTIESDEQPSETPTIESDNQPGESSATTHNDRPSDSPTIASDSQPSKTPTIASDNQPTETPTIASDSQPTETPSAVTGNQPIQAPSQPVEPKPETADIVGNNHTPDSADDDIPVTDVVDDGDRLQNSQPISSVVLDFEADSSGRALTAGDVIDHEFKNYGVSITTNDSRNHPALIFDTRQPTGNDFDLAMAPGIVDNVLIISEDADSSDPDDNASGGTIQFTFDALVGNITVGVLDIDLGHSDGYIEALDSQGSVLGRVTIPTTGNDQLDEIHLGVTGIAILNISLEGSGAITELSYDVFSPNPSSIVEQGQDANLL